MKKSLFIITSLFLSNLLFSQQIKVNLGKPSLNQCDTYALVVDGTPLNRIGTSCDFEMPELIDGKSYTLEIQSTTGTGSTDLSTFDIVLMYRLILEFDEIPLSAYVADLDQDGAVGTYDLIKIRQLILFEDTETPPSYHVIKSNAEIPEIDFLDIQVDYSKLEFTSEDFISGEMEVSVLQLGNLDRL